MIEPYIQKIIFVDQPFMDELKHQSMVQFKEFQSPALDTKVITLPVAPGEILQLMAVMDSSEIKAGGVMVKASYTEQFVSADSFAEDCAIRKYRLWILLCLALGAKNVNVTNVEEVSLGIETDASISAKLDVKTPLAEVETEFKKNDLERHGKTRKSIMEIHASAAGSDPNLAEADRILKSSGLLKDDMFRSIYDMRSVSTNRVTRHVFSLDLSSDIKKVLDSSLKAKIKVMSALYAGRAEFETVKKSLETGRTALQLAVTVDF